MLETTFEQKTRFPLKRVPKEMLAALYQAGQSLADIARTFGVTRQAVFKALKAHGVARRGQSDARILAFSKGKFEGKSTAQLNEAIFSKWSQPMAYVLGYIFTDGCLTNVGPRRKDRSPVSFAVKIASSERDHIEKLAAILGRNIRIRTIKQSKKGFSGGGDRYLYEIQFTRPRMIDNLRKLGLTERKSLTMRFPSVPDEFFHDFVRGCWDGDGSIFIGTDGRPAAYFGTGSLGFIQEMSRRLRNLGLGRLTIHVKKPDGVKSKNPHYYIRITGNYAVIFCQLLYDNVPTQLMLLRKALVYEYWRSQHPLVSSDVPIMNAPRSKIQRCRHIERGKLCTLPASKGDVYCDAHQRLPGTDLVTRPSWGVTSRDEVPSAED